MTLRLVLLECETWSLTLKEALNTVPRQIFGPKREHGVMADMAKKLTVAFRKFANGPEKGIQCFGGKTYRKEVFGIS
jgi:hypothetical protein